MKSIIVLSVRDDAVQLIRDCFRSKYKVNQAPNVDTALNLLRKKRYEFIFADLEILRESVKDKGLYERYKAAFKPFWLIYPSIEIIVMTSQERIRDAVMAVKAGGQ